MKISSLLTLCSLLAPSSLVLAQDKEKPQDTATPAAATAEADKADDKAESKMIDNVPVHTGNASDATINLRTKLELVPEKLKELETPVESFVNTVNARVDAQLERLKELDALSVELAKAEADFQNSLIRSFEFTVVKPVDRMKYVTDGQALYQALVNGLKDKSIEKKVDALNYFEEMHTKYRGLPEYELGAQLYYDMIEKLHEHWSKQLESENKKRERMSDKKRDAADEDEDEIMEKITAELGEEVTTYVNRVWMAPPKKCYKLLRLNVTRSTKALETRPAKYIKKDDDKKSSGVYINHERKNDDQDKNPEDVKGAGVVPEMLTEVWAHMDAIAKAMSTGELDKADELLEDDEKLRELISLNRHMLPEDYRREITEQYRELEQEIRKRLYDKRDKERAISNLERELTNATKSSESQIEAIYEDIARAKENELRRKEREEERARQLKEREERRRKAAQKSK